MLYFLPHGLSLPTQVIFIEVTLFKAKQQLASICVINEVDLCGGKDIKAGGVDFPRRLIHTND